MPPPPLFPSPLLPSLVPDTRLSASASGALPPQLPSHSINRIPSSSAMPPPPPLPSLAPDTRLSASAPGHVTVHIKMLHLDATQTKQIQQHYDAATNFHRLFSDELHSQQEASCIKRWSKPWKRTERVYSHAATVIEINTYSIPFQSQCGTSTDARKTKDDQQQMAKGLPINEKLASKDPIWNGISRLFFSITSIQARNVELCHAKLYSDQATHDPRTMNVRYEILPSDSCRLYRKYSRMHGIDVSEHPQYNLDNWLNPESTAYKPELAGAVFDYQARVEKDGRLRICIQTAEMKDAAWKYAHQGQLILDGTFGICDRRVLLFIALGIDEGKRGSFGFFLFSALQETKPRMLAMIQLFLLKF
ncbi:hypothetical protein JB92DRAFT_2969083 [Gautieria morchelliformis]|nr:hypothetical protein JB92DRAFT_2969083 [Gautieria morchelliformis]